MKTSVLDAIKEGVWDFEPESVDTSQYAPTEAIPGSEQKVSVLAERLQRGLPLWHPEDRIHHADPAMLAMAMAEMS